MKAVNLFLLLLLLAGCNAAPVTVHTSDGDTLQRWTGGFEIHVFQVGQGHSQLVIYPSGYSVLIDVMEPSWNTCKGARLVAEKVEAVLGHTHVNVGSPSHWHLDHLGYAGYGGFWCLLEEGLMTFDTILDRDGAVWTGDKNGNDECDEEEIEWHNAGTIGGTAIRWVCYATDPKNSKIYNIRQIARFGSDDQLVPPDALGKITIVAADGRGVYQQDGVTPVSGRHTTDAFPPSENDYSIGFLFEFGAFRFITAGDSDGEYATSNYGYSYNDVETMMANNVGGVDAMLVNHHGSSHSTNPHYVKTLQPQVSMISCGVANTHDHPAQRVLDTLFEDGSDVYLNNICALDRNYGKSVIVDGDIVLKSENGNIFNIGETFYFSRRGTGVAGGNTTASKAIVEA